MTERTEIAHRQEGGALAAPVSNSAQFLAMLLDAARDPSIDAEKVKSMADLAMQLQDREQVSQFNRDRAAAIAEMPIITKDGRIIIPANRDKGTPEREQGRFARLEDIDRVVKPIARRHNLTYSWDIGEADGVPKVFIELSHDNGYVWRSSGMRMPLDTSGSKNNTQGAGSATTYGKRYTLCAAFNIQTENDDTDGTLPDAPTHLPAERGNAVLTEAEAAHEAGGYEKWFATQSPKDRAWLITHGHHARFGGQVALPDMRGKEGAPVEDQRRDAPDESTPEGWVAGYEARLTAAQTMDDLSRITTRGVKGMDRLKNGHPDLHKRGVTAESTAYARLSATGDHGGDE